jgi:hypothetical protein
MKEKEFLNEIKSLYPEAEIRNGSEHYKVLLSKGFTTVARHPSQEVSKKHCLDVLRQLKVIKQREQIEEIQARKAENWRHEVQDLSLIKGECRILPAAERGRYSGIVIHVDGKERFCVQKIAPNVLIIHDREKIERLPGKGEIVKIEYIGVERAKIFSL